MKNIVCFLCLSLGLISCTKENAQEKNVQTTDNKILMLKVDYTTNTFEGGKELSFDVDTPTFTTNFQYVPPGDFGSIKIFYNELNTLLFDGDMIWMGLGTINYPTDFLPASSFPYSFTTVIIPLPNYENIFNPDNQVYNYTDPLGQVIYLNKVIDYRNSNPTGVAKLFLYQPSVGVGDPATWKWIIMFKN